MDDEIPGMIGDYNLSQFLPVSSWPADVIWHRRCDTNAGKSLRVWDRVRKANRNRATTAPLGANAEGALPA